MYANFYTHTVYVFERNLCEILCVLQAVYSNVLGKTFLGMAAGGKVSRPMAEES